MHSTSPSIWAEAAAQLRALLARMDAGRMDATPTMRARIEGALEQFAISEP